MNLIEVQARLDNAVNLLLNHQPNLSDFTSETGQTEWNIAHHLANEIHSLFPEHDCDLDITKPNLGNRRPDIILHKRGSQARNFLVIEVKRDISGTADDLEKIKNYWFVEPLKYKFGAVIVVNEGQGSFIKVIENATPTVLLSHP